MPGDSTPELGAPGPERASLSPASGRQRPGRPGQRGGGRAAAYPQQLGGVEHIRRALGQHPLPRRRPRLQQRRRRRGAGRLLTVLPVRAPRASCLPARPRQGKGGLGGKYSPVDHVGIHVHGTYFREEPNSVQRFFFLPPAIFKRSPEFKS